MKNVIKLSNKSKEILTYSLSMSILLLLLKSLEAHYIIFDYRLEFLVSSIAIVFMVLGIWLTLKFVKPKIEHRIIEKRIYLNKSISEEINKVEIAKLGISKRELEVLKLMTTGLSNEEIAENLFISLNTVKTHCSNIYLKLEVKRRTQAVEKAKRLNLIN